MFSHKNVVSAIFVLTMLMKLHLADSDPGSIPPTHKAFPQKQKLGDHFFISTFSSTSKHFWGIVKYFE